MIELESSLIPNLSKIKLWKRYMYHTICFVNIGWIEYIISVSKETFNLHMKLKVMQITFFRCATYAKDITTTAYQKQSKSDIIYTGTLLCQYHIDYANFMQISESDCWK